MTFAVRATIVRQDILRRKLKRMSKELEAPVRKAVERSALKIQGDARKLIANGQRSGEVYMKTKSRKRHRASAPGEPPKLDTGRLNRSIQVAFPIENRGLAAVVGTNEKYGKWLEFGTDRLSHQPNNGARPWLLPTWKKNAPQIAKVIRKAVREALRSKRSVR